MSLLKFASGYRVIVFESSQSLVESEYELDQSDVELCIIKQSIIYKLIYFLVTFKWVESGLHNL